MSERLSPLLAGVVVAFCCCPHAPASDFDVVINEISYNPWTADDRDEFVELYNAGPAAVDLAGWSFTEGIRYTFPAGSSIGAGQYLVLSPDANHTALHYRIANVAGDYTGRLDNNGEILTLVNARGAVIGQVHYADDDPWPTICDGLGPTLELTDARQSHLPQKWAASLFLDGTPGGRNSRVAVRQPSQLVVEEGGLFRIWKGTAEPSNPLGAWAAASFDDRGWPEERGPFGMGSYQVGTALNDMSGGYTDFYLRRSFDLSAGTLAAIRAGASSLVANLSYDDGFVAYLNGEEVGRANLGAAGTLLPRDAIADSSLNDGSLILNLDPYAGVLRESGNVLAIQAANRSLNGSDFLVGVEVSLTSRQPDSGGVTEGVEINEVRPSEGAGGNGFIELYNPLSEPAEVSGFYLVDSRDARFRLPSPTVIPERSFLAFGEAQLGFPPALAGARYALVRADGLTWVDGLELRAPPAGRTGLSFGRFPDGGGNSYLMTAPTKGAANQLVLETAVVLNEIRYHPAFVAPSGGCFAQCSDPDQWIELHNRTAQAVDVSLWSLTKAVEITIPPGTSIPGSGFLVLAADRGRFLAANPGVDGARVVGGWTKSLSRAADTINLRNALGNLVDHVRYGDGSPVNDEEPADGVDDRTVASSEWPPEADDGQGRSLELVHPGLDNRAGAAWRAGPVGGTPARANGALDADPPPMVFDVAHSPVVPRSSQPVRITCRASSVPPLTRVEAIWHLDPQSSSGTVELHDDGLSGDGAAGDGVYGGTIPGQGPLSVVAFQVRAQAQDGQSALVPRSPAVRPYNGFEGPYYLYQVDDNSPPANGSVDYRVVMTDADLAELRGRPVTSNVLLPCTFIGEGKAYHTVGIRIRGENSRNLTRKAWRIDFPPERGFRGLEHVNLVASGVENELMAADLFRRAGMPAMQEWSVNLFFRGVLDPQYAFKENMDGEFLERAFGGSSGGNLYRGMDPLGGGTQGDLSYHGEDPDDYRDIYDKRTNREEDDFSDIIELCRAFDGQLTPAEEFPERLDSLIDARQWARFFAVQGCLTNIDGGIETVTGEDYLLYHVPADSNRPDRGRWLLLPWDIEETFTSATERLFRPDVTAIRRFLTHPLFAPLYYQELVELEEGAFSRSEIRKSYYLVESIFGATQATTFDGYVLDRNTFFQEQVSPFLRAGVVTGTAAGVPIIELGDNWRYFKGLQEPSGGTRAWTTRGFDDAVPGWQTGATGIGYGDNDDATVLTDMENSYTTVYARKVFVVADPAALTSLNLEIDFDDGFVAYLNGDEVARRNAPGGAGSFVPFDATANLNRESGQPETIDLSAFRGLLVGGNNVLAIQVMNFMIASSDLSLLPRLLTGSQPSTGAGCGDVLFALGPSINLEGTADAARTRAVEVNGLPAPYDGYRARWSASVPLEAGENLVRVEAFDGSGRSTEVLDLKVFRFARPFTLVGGTLGSSTTWTASGGPYLLTQDLVVPAGIGLTIEAGTVVITQAGSSIQVRGTLQALGTREAPILFRPYSCQARLGGVIFDNTGTGAGAFQHRLRFCDFNYGQNAGGLQGNLVANGSKLLLEDCVLRDFSGRGLDADGARIEVRRSLFERMHQAARAARSVAALADSTFSLNIGGSDLVLLDGTGAERSLIERCLFEEAQGNGVRLRNASVDVRDSIFRREELAGLVLEGKGALGGSSITGDLVHDCGTGLLIRNGAEGEGNHATITGNEAGISLAAAAGEPDGGHAVFHSMIVWDNLTAVTADSRSTVSFEFSDLSAPWPGAQNISADPKFMSGVKRDFSLRAGSPAIATGKAATDMGAIPYGGPVVRFIRGDGNADGSLGVADAITALEYLYRAHAGPSCLDRLDTNDDARIDISDPIYLLFYLFGGGTQPPLPFPGQGVDPTGDGIVCQ